MNEKRRVVFVLGAGASNPYGFPLGSALRDLVIQPDQRDIALLGDLGVAEDETKSFCEAIQHSNVDSLDQFLEQRTGFGRVCKLLMARKLSSFENDSLSGGDGGGRWYQYFFNALIEGEGHRRLATQSHISIITFNYDRSLDYWLMRTIENRRGISSHDARQSLLGFCVIHVHGTLGGTPLTDAHARAYGIADTPEQLEQCASGITLISEAESNSGIWHVAQERLKFATHVVFLGFGYNPTNLRRLALQECCTNRHGANQFGPLLKARGIPNRAQVFGTTQGLTPGEVRDRVLPQLRGVVSETMFRKHNDMDVLGWLRANPGLLRCE